jgi:heme/copper-type cytochrome/quinol oxidase subunit 2
MTRLAFLVLIVTATIAAFLEMFAPKAWGIDEILRRFFIFALIFFVFIVLAVVATLVVRLIRYLTRRNGRPSKSLEAGRRP